MSAAATPVDLRPYLWRAAAGLGLGTALSFIGFSRFEEVHRMFLFADLRLFLTFAGAVVLCAAGFWLMRRARTLPARPLHKGAIPGGVLFGAGWAICGACPGIVLVQLGEGKAWAGVTVLGLLAGNAAYGWMHARYLKWDVQSCAE